ncbi:threonine dehydratase [Methylobacterium indicum]|uniref:Threonine ammonia-lyase n=2 Tax=Methylobacterium indicum TaxID=1775910 RepID=A0A8H8WRZ7_9HYPH|nr:threonine ammonia-lyase [Methylobacterium indicum]KMO11943.1 threonine dehydratase [Methylobacterium indicum]KTS17951.1 threonine dehydratase [Methylobacterium indicum]KTS32720.1 threonine dehydratase [Methylobacterium indicum]KTS53449.1 threonine dehydratase [Methylobacterium indicum]BCM83190.1 threonine ammonia-lyase [Methylobacterium indicum]
MSQPYAITPDDVVRASHTIRGHVLRTPLVPAPRLSELTGARVLVKHENMQATGAFKERGAVNRLSALTPDERRRGVVAMSAGNHAQAVAYHARRLGIPATIVMPATTPLVKVENTRAHGATVVLEGETLVESAAAVDRLVAAHGFVLVHPYDDPLVMAGQGTIALEMLEDAPDLDCLVVPIGGGGLMSGIAVGASLRPRVALYGVEAALYPSFLNAIDGVDRPIGGPTLAEGIAVKTVGRLTLPIIRDRVREIVLVDEPQIERAVHDYATLQRSLAEGAGAAGLAALLARPDLFAGRTVGLVLCGGNIDARLLASVMVRELERADRIISFRMTASDRPGVLGQVAGRLGDLGANILEVSHGRLHLDVPAKSVSIDVTIETRGPGHTAEILQTLREEGLEPRRIGPLGTAATGG